jgi:hypothetical protein
MKNFKESKQDYLKKKTNRSNFKRNNNNKEKFKVRFREQETEYTEENINYEKQEEEQGLSKDIVKVGKYWEGKNLIEPKNTKDKITILENENLLISIVEDSLKIFDLNDLSLKTTIKQVYKI